jgi:hypothetical protein
MAGLLPSGGYGTGSEVMRRIAVLIAGGMVSRRQGKWMIMRERAGALSEQLQLAFPARPHTNFFWHCRESLHRSVAKCWVESVD